MGLFGINIGFGGNSQKTGPYDDEVWRDTLRKIQGLYGDMESGNIGDQYNIFGGRQGQQYLENINRMISGDAATDLVGSIQNQIAPQYSAQLDKVMQSLNPNLRGSGIGAQIGKDISTQSNRSLADALIGLKSNFFQQGTGLLGDAQTTQTGFNLQQADSIRKLLAMLSTVGSNTSGTQWGVNASYGGGK